MIWFWDTATGRPTATLDGCGAEYSSGLAFSPDDRLLATDRNDFTLGLWDPVSGQRTATFEHHAGELEGLAFSPDGRHLATASCFTGRDGTVELWDCATGQMTGELAGFMGRVKAVAFSPDGAVLATAGHDRTVRLWESARLALISQLVLESDVVTLAWGADGVAVGCFSGEVILFAVIDPKAAARVRPQRHDLDDDRAGAAGDGWRAGPRRRGC